ncbi:hypothetical protein EPI10_021938 [Gossypium australe]|uniref:Uncharacterized protein n=1 Tax=Gossypium australe TaxID=47621 RepID=A0A5B6WIU0_9ROSI|nr:hypothetical protein EPI10_021938 [Gossypium australe]
MVRKFIWGNSSGGKKLTLVSWKSRALFKIWPLLCENIFWFVRNGNKIRCWSDNWISGVGPLVNQIPSYGNLDVECTLKNLVNTNGSWDLGMF